MNQHIRFQSQADLWERERLLEMEMSGLGRERFLKILEEAKRTGRETVTPGANAALQSAITPVATAIQSYLDEGKKRGRPPSIARKHLSKVPAETAAFITAKVIFDKATSTHPQLKTALAIADALEDAWRIETSEKDEWSKEDKVHLGQQCITLFSEQTGMVESVVQQRNKKQKERYLAATPACAELITDRNARCELLSPTFMPTIVPPKPWTAPESGGYWFLPRPLRFIKSRNREYLKELVDAPAMASVYRAVNAMQNTAWKVNSAILAVMQQVWEQRLALGGLQFWSAHPLPLCPMCQQQVDTKRRDHECFTTDKAVLGEWKRAAAKVHAANGKATSRQLQVAKVLWVAEKFKDEEAFYFPTQLDFRGRAYSVPMFLNPQGADWAKGLLTFANGKPITDDRAAGWLKVHGANCYGLDKITFDRRIAWIEEHEADILACAEDPLGHTFWSDADKPWQFLAFCFEYAGFKREGFGFVSTLPVALDGSCNGLQHFSAMLRDPVGGAAVNLLPSEKPNDIYQTVCDRLIEKMKADNSPHAKAWLALKPDRKLTKRPVMTLPYGSTMFSCKDYVADWLAEQEHGWGDKAAGHQRYAVKAIWQSIGEVVVSARRAMDWLQKAARVASAEGQSVRWTAPDGLPLLQAYPKTDEYQVRTKAGGKLVRFSLHRETGKLDKRRQANGISPNFVHSMDAAALRMYVLLAKDNGITSFALVHDSYGTLAADTDMSAACLREAFVNMYEGRNHLDDLRTSLAGSVTNPSKLPPVPAMGTLNLEGVRKATYFFA